jgi:NTP pyrophosphatase (non-canonical NTP hydrolase)
MRVDNSTLFNLNYMNKQQETEAILLLAKTNSAAYNLLKAAEELAELSEVVLKMHNKSPKNKPKVEKLIEEIGDVELRLKILKINYAIKEQVKERVQNKLSELLEYYNKNMYIGGL